VRTFSRSSQFARKRPFNGASDRQETPIWAPRRGSLNVQAALCARSERPQGAVSTAGLDIGSAAYDPKSEIAAE